MPGSLRHGTSLIQGPATLSGQNYVVKGASLGVWSLGEGKIRKQGWKRVSPMASKKLETSQQIPTAVFLLPALPRTWLNKW